MVVEDSVSLRPSVARSNTVKGAKKWLKRLVVAIALGWTVYSYRHLRIYSWSTMRHDTWAAFVRLPWLIVPYIIFEIAFCVGAIMMVVGIGQKVFVGGKVASIWNVRKRVKELFRSDTTSEMYRQGLYLNWVGAAMTTGILPIVSIMWLYSVGHWLGLMALPLIDLTSTFVWRIAARPKPNRKKNPS